MNKLNNKKYKKLDKNFLNDALMTSIAGISSCNEKYRLMIELLIAFGAGLISFLSPCVLPLIPGYVSFISGQSLQDILKVKKN